MSFLAATALAAVAANVCLGAFVFLYRRERLINQLFFAFSIFLAVWCLSIYLLANPVGEVWAVLSARMMIYASLLASVLFLHLVLRLFGSPSRLLRTADGARTGCRLTAIPSCWTPCKRRVEHARRAAARTGG